MKKPDVKRLLAAARRRERKTAKARRRDTHGQACIRYGRSRRDAREQSWVSNVATPVPRPSFLRRTFSEVRRWVTRRQE